MEKRKREHGGSSLTCCLSLVFPWWPGEPGCWGLGLRTPLQMCLFPEPPSLQAHRTHSRTAETRETYKLSFKCHACYLPQRPNSWVLRDLNKAVLIQLTWRHKGTWDHSWLHIKSRSRSQAPIQEKLTEKTSLIDVTVLSPGEIHTACNIKGHRI